MDEIEKIGQNRQGDENERQIGERTLEISFLSRSMVSLRYFFTMPMVATALVLSVWMTCKGAIRPSWSIFRSTTSSSSPASSRMRGLDVK